MPVYKVVMDQKVTKFLNKIPGKEYKRFLQKIDIIAQDPYASLSFVEKMQNSPYFRFRFGDYRCMYNIVNNILTIVVVNVNHRKTIYRSPTHG